MSVAAATLPASNAESGCADYDHLSLAARIAADVRSHGGLLDSICALGFWAICVHRVAHALTSLGLDLPARVLQVFSQVFLRCDISRKARIGPGVRLFHASSIFIGPHVRVGRDSTIGPETFIGANTRWSDPSDYPVIGDDVVIGPGARVMGRLHIGSGTWVGPNAVVMRSIPAGSIVAAPPCRVVPRHTFGSSNASAAAACANHEPPGVDMP
jgi:serine O-acetyltransferase